MMSTLHWRVLSLLPLLVLLRSSSFGNGAFLKNVCKRAGPSSSSAAGSNVLKLCQRKSSPSFKCWPWFAFIKNGVVADCYCCNGWTKYVKEVGCVERQKPKPTSCVSLPQKTPKKCEKARREDLEKQRSNYKLTSPPRNITEDPNTVTDIKDVLSCPLLDMSKQKVIGEALADPNQRNYVPLFKYINDRNDDFVKLNAGNPHIFQSLSEYANIYKRAVNYQVANPAQKKYFRHPPDDEPFKNIIDTGSWKDDDDVFTEQRLAGLNVHSIQVVVPDACLKGISLSELRKKLNNSFDWNCAFSRTNGNHKNLEALVKDGSVFVAFFPLMKGLTNVPDLAKMRGESRDLRKSTSPIAIFVSTGKKLKPVAIQVDDKEDSPVYTPTDGKQWLMAKTEFQLADFAYVEMIEHLLKAHFLLESICVTVRRTVSKYHPLMQLMKHHCIGVSVTNSVGVPKLLGKYGLMHQMFSIGHVGGIELVNRAYAELSWDDMDLNLEIAKRGVSDRRKLPYYPYRDDGRDIFNLLRRFARDYINAYYPNRCDVLRDTELQNFANELSRDGTGKNGGVGMLRGFPPKISSKKDLIQTLTRIVWVILRHHTVNYPVNYYASFVPNMPSKLYNYPGLSKHEFSLNRFSTSPYVAGQVSLGFSLAALRYDHLFDYSDKMEDKVGACIVKGYYDKLMSDIKSRIERRNRRRLQQGHLTYPYLQPGWIPNSIHT